MSATTVNANLTIPHSAKSQRGNFSKVTRLAPSLIGVALLASVGNALAVESVEISGELDVIIKEDFDHGRFEHDYFVRDSAGQSWYQLQFKTNPPANWKSGQRVKLRGQPQGRKFQVDSLDLQGAATTAVAPMATQLVDERKAVVLMVDLVNAKASTRYTLSQIVGQMYTNSRSVDGLYRAASLGQAGFTADSDNNGQPDVFGPFPISYDNSNCDYYSWANAAEAAAQAAGINLSLYKHRVFVLPRYSDLPSCTWAGIANVGCGTYCRAWIAEAESGMVYAHELGHNMNMAHAGTDPGNDGTIDVAYGDSSDPMGSSRAWHVFSAPHIDQMGWYSGTAGAVTTVTASGSYDLAAIGNVPMASGAPSVLKIAKKDSSDFYYLSYRQALNYDSTLSSTYTSGVNIHRYKGTGYAPTAFIKTLSNGAIFNDTVNGITITQVSQASGYATVQVSFGCATQTPSVSVAPARLVVRPGAAVNYAVSVSNQDVSGCNSTTFGIGYTGGSVSGLVSPASLTLAAGQSGSGALSANSNLADGSYSLAVSVTDTDGVAPNHSAATQATATLVVDSTAPSVPNGLKGVVDRQGRISLSWLAATDALSGVAAYTVYRNGTVIAQVASGTTYIDSTAASGSSYQYTVSARDAAGNTSVASTAITVTAGSSTKTTGKK